MVKKEVASLYEFEKGTWHGRPQHFLKGGGGGGGGASRGRGAPIGKGRGEDNKFCWSIHISNFTVQIITISRYRLYVYENIRLDRSIFLGWSVKNFHCSIQINFMIVMDIHQS